MSSKGQILVPSLFIFPALVLFAILIVEVAKLSQQKVLMQFAMDTSVFMEASQLSDAANRLAYLNSPWPTRVLQGENDTFEIIGNWNFPSSNSPCGKRKCFGWHFLLKNGVYPSSLDRNLPDQPSISASASEENLGDTWQGAFRAQPSRKDPEVAQRNDLNVANPPEDLGTWFLFTYEDVEGIGIGSDFLGGDLKQDDVQAIYGSLIEVYTYFYQLATMVKLVYEKLNKVFFKKTFWLNTGFTPDADLAPSYLPIQHHCTHKVSSWFSIWQPPGGYSPYRWDPIDISVEGQGRCDESSTTGIWQLSTIPGELAVDNRPARKRLPFRNYHYTGPGNHFGVEYRDLFGGIDPWVHASAEIAGGRIWPHPKPTFQVRLKP